MPFYFQRQHFNDFLPPPSAPLTESPFPVRPNPGSATVNKLKKYITIYQSMLFFIIIYSNLILTERVS